LDEGAGLRRRGSRPQFGDQRDSPDRVGEVLAFLTALRTDLIISRHETSEGTQYVLKDPRTRRFFRFREAEYAIARRLDGASSLDAVARDASAALDVDIDAESVKPFIDQLRRLGLLQTDQPASSGHGHAHRRVSGSLLYIRLKAFDPHRLFTRLVGKVGFFFTPWFIALSLVALLVAIGITVSSWDEILRDFRGLYRFDALLLAWVTVLLVTTAHEFAHGLTCKRFGGEVHEIGFLLLYFQPAFYCNISDAWLFPEKSKRIWVTAAGAYFEIFVWSLATLTWWVTEPGTWVSFLALIVMATSGVKTTFNLNPLIKLDGYYLLSDYLEIPNLRQRSFGYLKAVVKRLGGSTAAALQVTRRERRIFVTYGLLAAAYSYWLLSVVALGFGNYLVEQYQGPGFIAFSGLLMVAFKNPLGRAAGGLRASFRRRPAEPASTRPSEVPRTKRLLIRAALVMIALAVVFFGRLPLNVSGEFKVLPVRNADVRAAVDGMIERVYVEEGDRVRTGDVLVQLSARDYRAELDKIEAEIEEARARLKLLRAGPREEEIALARGEIQTARTRHEHSRRRFEEADRLRATRLSKAETTVNAARERLEYSRTDRQRHQELFEKRLISRKQLDDSQQELALREKELEVAEAEARLVSGENLADLRQDLAVTQNEVDEASGKLKLLLAGNRPETIEATEAAIARLETQQRYLADQVRLTTVVSPAAGIITTPKMKEKVGEQLKKGDLIVKVYELERITPEVVISEKEIADVTPGQQVALKARAYPGERFVGTVKAIAPAAIEDARLGRKVFRVTIQMDQASDLLKPEMTGNAKILCGKRTIVHLLTRRIARYVRVEFWSWW
jgi:putative peptide zinc metalloprotease protein